MDIETQIRDVLADFGCCEGYQNNGITKSRAALHAILGCHPRGFAFEPEEPACLGCGEPYPCREVKFIARALGLKIESS